MTENDITGKIVDSAYRIHTSLGPGLLESVYEAALAFELDQCGLHFDRQKAIPVFYSERRMEMGFRADLVVEDAVIVEIKSVDPVSPIHKKVLLTYLRLTDKRVGLLLNFNVKSDQRRNHKNR